LITTVFHLVCRTVAYQNDFFIVMFYVGIICHQLWPMPAVKQFTNALARVDLTNYLQYQF